MARRGTETKVSFETINGAGRPKRGRPLCCASGGDIAVPSALPLLAPTGAASNQSDALGHIQTEPLFEIFRFHKSETAGTVFAAALSMSVPVLPFNRGSSIHSCEG